MMVKIYLDLSDDIREELEGSGISISDVFTSQNIDYDNVTYELLPGQQDTGVRTRDLAQVILAAGASATSIIIALSLFFSRFQHRPRPIVITNLEEIRDAAGNVLLDNEGKPFFKEVKKAEMLEPHPVNDELALQFQLTDTIVFKVSTASKQINDQSEQKKQE